MKWTPRDIIAIIIVVSCFTLLIMGKDTIVTWTLLAVVGAYYGIDLSPWFRIGRNQPTKKGGNK